MMLVLLGLSWVALAQSEPNPTDSQSLFNSQVPDATITIKKHPLGADMVEITMTPAGYPPELLKSQIQKLGKYLHSDPRGLQVYDYVLDPSSPNSHFTKAQFAVDGVIVRQAGSVRLNPFAQAFAGAPKPWTIHALNLQFQSEVPTSATLKSYPGKAVRVEGRYENPSNPKLSDIEYRIQLVSQDPAKFDIPEPGANKASSTAPAPPKSSVDWTTHAVFVIAALSFGALVDSLLLRGRPRGRF